MKNQIFIIIILLLFIACGSENEATPATGNNNDTQLDENTSDLIDTDYNILFIGNSLTSTNNLPELVVKNAKNKGLNIGTRTVTRGNTAILDHWGNTAVHDLITSKLFDFVIIQQGPSSQAYGRQVLIEYGAKYKALCDQNDAELVYFMVWPAYINYSTFDGVIKNHEDAASMNNSILCPVGKVWKNYIDATSDLSYYGPDRFHPSLKGSVVAADVIVETLFP